MLYIDPRACIDCGACADACPVDAVLPADRLPDGQREYARINAEYFERDLPEEPRTPARPRPTLHDWGEPSFDRVLPLTSGRCGSRSSAPARPACTPPGTCCCTPGPK
ncbi:hypothetical protein SHKM778_50510 [Streptomyces sp. KM77-8]|uniref:4Fe-4S ferredoxin-type domain-containing protein n=1 Tax=Streptomyces haneummycinicus TaxID=3074435 RepID=A0AAT9HN21_9ACTN